jgi:choline dehydrogenase
MPTSATNGTAATARFRSAATPRTELNPVQAAFIDAAATCGLPYAADHNRPGAIGVGPLPRNARDGVRMSTSLTYLAAARHRPNLTVRGGVVADRVEVHGGAATGVRLAGGEFVPADRVVLAAGAYASPAIVQRSGIGPAVQLGSLGIGVVADLPGVGENVTDHPLVAVDLPTRPGVTGPRFQTMATLRSQLAPAGGAPDLHLFAAGPFDASPAGGVFGLVTGLVLPYSRGWVRLRSADPADPPRIDVAHLRHPDDMRRMIEATLLARAISRTAPPGRPGRRRRAGARPVHRRRRHRRDRRLDRIPRRHLPPPGRHLQHGPRPRRRGRRRCPRARTRQRLYIADASIMPAIPSANTNLPTIMIAERIASWLAADEDQP